MVILSLTLALAAGVVWWVTVGELPLFFAGRRSDGGAAARTLVPESESPRREDLSTPAPDPSATSATDVSTVPTAATRWPRVRLETGAATTTEKEEERHRPSPIRHRSSRSTFTYAQPAGDARPPLVLTILRLVFSIALVAGLITLGIWGLGRFTYSLITKLFE